MIWRSSAGRVILPVMLQETIGPSGIALLVVLAAILARGMSWSHLRWRMSGEADVDEVGRR